MEFNFKRTYVFLISHTLPGLVFAIQLILAFKLFTIFDGFNLLFKLDYKAINFIALLIIIYTISTLLGVIIDAIHHRIFGKVESKANYQIFQFIKNKDQLDLYRHIDEDYWHSYEAYANIALAMTPGIFLLPIFLSRLAINIYFVTIIYILYLIFFIILIWEALITVNIVFEIEKELLENFRDNSISSLASPPSQEKINV